MREQSLQTSKDKMFHKTGRFAKEQQLADGCEHYDPETMSAAALREALNRRGVSVPPGATREDLVRIAEDLKVGAESKHSA